MKNLGAEALLVTPLSILVEVALLPPEAPNDRLYWWPGVWDSGRGWRSAWLNAEAMAGDRPVMKRWCFSKVRGAPTCWPSQIKYRCPKTYRSCQPRNNAKGVLGWFVC